MKKKLHIEKINGGAKIFEGRSFGALKNLTPFGEGLVKRKGHKSVVNLSDAIGTKLRINGIFAYSYFSGGENHECKIVHAGSRIFKLDKSFNYLSELEIENGISLKDVRSRAFYNNGLLYIVGAGDILICDGETVKSAYFTSGTYVPTTSRMITDRRMGMKFEKHQSPNLLNPRRKNLLLGGGTHKNLNEVNVFLLDAEVKYGKPIVVDVKIRTKTSQDSDNEYTTSYIGVNEQGEEVSTVVNLHYERTNVDDKVLFFLTEPMRNERGEKIRIKIGDKIHDYDTAPFGVRLKNNREICFGFDVDAPYPNEENITVEYESSEAMRELLYDIDLATLGTHKSGGELLLFTRGNGELYYSDFENGFSYLPKDNRVSLGGTDKITGIVQLWDNIIGVFKKNGFYRVRFDGGECEVSPSADSLGACAPHTAFPCGKDCLVLSERGVFGVDDYKSSVREISILSPRSGDIDALLTQYSAEEKCEAVACVLDGRYYLFIGQECYVGVLKSNGEYDWFPWYSIGARVVSVLDRELYFGTENGEIRKTYNGYCDLCERAYSTETLSLIVDNEGEKTRLITDKTEIGGNASVKVSEHLLYIGSGKISQGTLEITSGTLTYNDGALKLLYGDVLQLKGNGTETEKTVKGAIQNTVYFDGEELDAELDGGEYEIWQKKQFGIYEPNIESNAICLKLGGETVKIDGFSSVLLEEAYEIPSEYKTAPISIGTHQKNATVTKIYLNAYSGTEGEIRLTASTRMASYERCVSSSPPFNFDALDFDRIDLAYGLDYHIPIPVFIRCFDYLDVKIEASDERPVYVGFLMLEYFVS